MFLCDSSDWADVTSPSPYSSMAIYTLGTCREAYPMISVPTCCRTGYTSKTAVAFFGQSFGDIWGMICFLYRFCDSIRARSMGKYILPLTYILIVSISIYTNVLASIWISIYTNTSNRLVTAEMLLQTKRNKTGNQNGL